MGASGRCGPRLHCQKPRLFRTRCGGFQRRWGRVQEHGLLRTQCGGIEEDVGRRPRRQEPVSSGSAAGGAGGESEAGGGGASGAGTLRGWCSGDPEGEGPGAASCAVTLCPRGAVRAAVGSSRFGLRGRGAARPCSCSAPTRFPQRPRAVRGPGAGARAVLALPPLWSRAGRGVRPVSATASWGIRCDGPASAGRPGQDGRGHWGRFLRVQGHRVVALHPCATSSVSVPSVLSAESRPVASWLRFPPGHVVAVVRGTVSFRRVVGSV